MENKLYILYNTEGINEDPVYGVFTSYDKAKEALDKVVEKMVEECFAVDPAESGLDPDIDRNWLEWECYNSLAIEIINGGLDSIIL